MVDWHDLIGAIGLLLIIEGLPFFLAPQLAKIAIVDLLNYSLNTLRIFGICLILFGLFSLHFLR